MSTLLTGSSAGPFVGTATAPANGDDVTGASIQVPVQALLDDAAFLNARTSPKVDFVLVQESPLVVDDGSVHRFNQGIAHGVTVYQNLELPHGAVVSQIDFRIAPAGGHGGLPGTMPELRFNRYNATSGTVTTVGTYDDASGSVMAYETPHDLTIGSLSETIDRNTYFYRVELDTETGANNVDGCILRTARVKLTTVDNST